MILCFIRLISYPLLFDGLPKHVFVICFNQQRSNCQGLIIVIFYKTSVIYNGVDIIVTFHVHVLIINTIGMKSCMVSLPWM